MLSLKDVTEINKCFVEGRVVNPGALDYVVKTQSRSKNWLRTAALFTRAIIVDHVFEDGNKRTAGAVLMFIMEFNRIKYLPEEIPEIVVSILTKNLTDIREIERCIKHGIR